MPTLIIITWSVSLRQQWRLREVRTPALLCSGPLDKHWHFNSFWKIGAGYSGGSCALSNSIFQTRHRHGHCPLELLTAITHWRLHKSVPTNFTLQGKGLPAFPQRFRQLTVVWGEVYEAVPLPRFYPQLSIAERYIFFSDIAAHKLLSFPSVTPVTHWFNKLYLDGIPSFCLWSVPSREQEICLFIWTMGQMFTRAFWERQSTLKGRGFRLFSPLSTWKNVAESGPQAKLVTGIHNAIS